MEFRTKIDLPKTDFRLEPFDRILLVGSCFAQKIGSRLVADKFRAVVNPDGVMYNPASVWHSLERYNGPVPRMAVITLGTNRVYIENSTGQIVDNCMKRPQRLFTERDLTVDDCVSYLRQTIDRLHHLNPQMMIVLTVSPIRYRKYGYHGSQLSKATLLLAVEKVMCEKHENLLYFPAYEIVVDELRDYRFYAEDMLHPSEQAADYIYEQFAQTFFSEKVNEFLRDWHPLRDALAHRPFNPDSEEYRNFQQVLQAKIALLKEKYPLFEV